MMIMTIITAQFSWNHSAIRMQSTYILKNRLKTFVIEVCDTTGPPA